MSRRRQDDDPRRPSVLELVLYLTVGAIVFGCIAEIASRIAGE